MAIQASFQSGVAPQLRAYLRNVESIVTGQLRTAAGRMQKRVRDEYLSGPPGIFSGAQYGTTGMTRRSVSKRVQVVGSRVTMELHVGGHAPKYQNVVSGVQLIFAQEAGSAISHIRSAVAVLGRGPRGVDVSSLLPAAPSVPVVAPAMSARERFKVQQSRRRFVRRAKKEARAAARERGLTGTERKTFVQGSVKRRIQSRWRKPRVR